MNIITIIGICASVLTALALLPQLIKLIKEKDSENISVGMLSILLIGLILWIIYGILNMDLIIAVSNSTSLLINLTTLFFTLKYKEES